jgi:hypothetical protein
MFLVPVVSTFLIMTVMTFDFLMQQASALSIVDPDSNSFRLYIDRNYEHIRSVHIVVKIQIIHRLSALYQARSCKKRMTKIFSWVMDTSWEWQAIEIVHH